MSISSCPSVSRFQATQSRENHNINVTIVVETVQRTPPPVSSDRIDLRKIYKSVDRVVVDSLILTGRVRLPVLPCLAYRIQLYTEGQLDFDINRKFTDLTTIRYYGVKVLKPITLQ